MKDMIKTFGNKVFNDEVMKQRLSKKTYEQLNNTIRNGEYLNDDIAEEVANAMKEWAIENGATHFTHWFHPLSGATAEKHESFISTAGGGKITLEFSPVKPGIRLPTPLSKTISCVFLQSSVPIQAKPWIIRHRY